MNGKTIAHALAGACLIATTGIGSVAAHAAASDYRFEVADVKAAATGKSDVTLRLIHIADKKPVTDAVLFEIKADMGPEGMPTMTAPAKALPASQPGLYVIEIEAGMAGLGGASRSESAGRAGDSARLASRQAREMTCARFSPPA